MKTPKQIKRWLYKARLRACVWKYPLEKFAQLIVRECASVSENYAAGSMPLSIALAIKEHFGVE